MAKLIVIIKRFRGHNTGQIGMMFALLVVPLMLIMGGVIDYGMHYNYSRKLQATVDMVNLAIAKEIAKNSRVKESRLNELANLIFKSNFESSDILQLEPYKFVRDGKSIKLNQSAKLKTFFLKIIGIDKMPVKVSSTVSINNAKVEVALVLDLSGSMGGSRIHNLKIASNDLVDILLPRKVSESNTRIALVPWTGGVFMGRYSRTILNGHNTCAKGRTNYYKDVSGSRVKMEQGRWCNARPLIPLTNRRRRLTKQINGWFASGGTDSSSGLALAWGVLSPEWNNVWKSVSKAHAYNESKKYIILMTDGSNGSTANDVASAKLCSEMKRKNIQIYAISYGASGKAEEMLKDCVSTPEMYIEATSGEILKQAFTNIATEIGNIHISG